MDAYGAQLAAIHHADFGDMAEAAAGLVVSQLRRRGFSHGLVVDLGCGSGILARDLTRAGYDVLGVDISPDMIRLARTVAPKAKFRVGSLLDTDIPACVAVTAIGEVLNYAFDSRSRVGRLTALFRQAHRALASGGLLVFDVAGPDRTGPGGATEVFHDHKDWSMHVAFKRRGMTLSRAITTFRKSGREYRRTDERHVVHLYRPSDVEDRLRIAGFRVRQTRRYGGLAFPPRPPRFRGHEALATGLLVGCAPDDRDLPRPRPDRPAPTRNPRGPAPRDR